MAGNILKLPLRLMVSEEIHSCRRRDCCAVPLTAFYEVVKSEIQNAILDRVIKYGRCHKEDHGG